MNNENKTIHDFDFSLICEYFSSEIFHNKYAGNKTAEEMVASQNYEEELYRKYKQFYGYTFFIAKKIEL